MLCPLKAVGVSEPECNFDCAWWDQKYDKCIEVTKTRHLEQIASSLEHIQRMGINVRPDR